LENCRAVTSKTVEDEANVTLDKVVMNTIKEVGLDSDEIFDDLSIIIDDCERKLNDNLKMIDRLAINEEIKREKAEEVMEIYVSYANKYRRSKPYTTTWSLSHKFRSVVSDIRKIEESKLKEIQRRIDEKGGIAGINDIEIVSEAVALKEERFPRNIFYIASNDQHIAGGHLEPWSEIRRELENKFSTLPRFPEEILKEM